MAQRFFLLFIVLVSFACQGVPDQVSKDLALYNHGYDEWASVSVQHAAISSDGRSILVQIITSADESPSISVLAADKGQELNTSSMGLENPNEIAFNSFKGQNGNYVFQIPLSEVKPQIIELTYILPAKNYVFPRWFHVYFRYEGGRWEWAQWSQDKKGWDWKRL